MFPLTVIVTPKSGIVISLVGTLTATESTATEITCMVKFFQVTLVHKLFHSWHILQVIEG